MAVSEMGNPIGLVDKRVKPGTTDGTGVGTRNTQAYMNVGSLRTALAASTAHGSGYYTTARLDLMTKNDMVNALRLINDPGSI